MTNNKSNSSSSISPKKNNGNSHSPSYSPVTYILGKRTREEESSSSDSSDSSYSSDSSAQSIMWKQEWDEPYLDLLDRVTLRQFKGMKVFDNALWHRFAEVLQKEVGSKEFDGSLDSGSGHQTETQTQSTHSKVYKMLLEMKEEGHLTGTQYCRLIGKKGMLEALWPLYILDNSLPLSRRAMDIIDEFVMELVPPGVLNILNVLWDQGNAGGTQ